MPATAVRSGGLRGRSRVVAESTTPEQAREAQRLGIPKSAVGEMPHCASAPQSLTWTAIQLLVDRIVRRPAVSVSSVEAAFCFPGVDMRIMLAPLVALALLAGCEPKTDRDTGAVGRDTIVTSERVKDTTIVTADTTIDVDTLSKTDHIKPKKE